MLWMIWFGGLIWCLSLLGAAATHQQEDHENDGDDEMDGQSSRKILGSSVVTSVSVVMETGNGKHTYYADAAGNPITKPHIASQVASPINLLNPDRYEFYTFNDNGELVKRLMTLEEIQGIIAGGGDNNDNTNYNTDYNQQTSNSDHDVSGVVENVQNVLKEEMESYQNPSAINKPILDTPDVSATWNMILPSIFGDAMISDGIMIKETTENNHENEIATEHLHISSREPEEQPDLPINAGIETKQETTVNIQNVTTIPPPLSSSSTTRKSPPLSITKSPPSSTSKSPPSSTTKSPLLTTRKTTPSSTTKSPPSSTTTTKSPPSSTTKLPSSTTKSPPPKTTTTTTTQIPILTTNFELDTTLQQLTTTEIITEPETTTTTESLQITTENKNLHTSTLKIPTTTTIPTTRTTQKPIDIPKITTQLITETIPTNTITVLFELITSSSTNTEKLSSKITDYNRTTTTQSSFMTENTETDSATTTEFNIVSEVDKLITNQTEENLTQNINVTFENLNVTNLINNVLNTTENMTVFMNQTATIASTLIDNMEKINETSNLSNNVKDTSTTLQQVNTTSTSTKVPFTTLKQQSTIRVTTSTEMPKVTIFQINRTSTVDIEEINSTEPNLKMMPSTNKPEIYKSTSTPVTTSIKFTTSTLRPSSMKTTQRSTTTTISPVKQTIIPTTKKVLPTTSTSTTSTIPNKKLNVTTGKPMFVSTVPYKKVNVTQMIKKQNNTTKLSTTTNSTPYKKINVTKTTTTTSKPISRNETQSLSTKTSTISTTVTSTQKIENKTSNTSQEKITEAPKVPLTMSTKKTNVKTTTKQIAATTTPTSVIKTTITTPTTTTKQPIRTTTIINKPIHTIKPNLTTKPFEPYRRTEELQQHTTKPILNTWKLVETMNPPENLNPTSTPIPISTTNLKPLNPEPTVTIDLNTQGTFGVPNLSDDMFIFSKLFNELALKFWKSLSVNDIRFERSATVSPFGAISMLAMIFLGARGSTSGEMNDVLKLDDIVTFNPHLVFKEVTESITSRKSTSAIVRELYADHNKGKIHDFYKERVRQFYDGHVEEVDFKRINNVIRRRTNALINKQTRGQVPQYLEETTLSLRAPLSALNTNLFQADCSQASIEGRDGELYFIVLPSMRQRRLVPIPAAVWRSGFIAGYDPELDATAVSLGNANQAINTVFVIPGQQGHSAPGDVLLRLEARLLNTTYIPETWTQLLKSMLPRPGLEIQLPRFLHKSVVNITNTLKLMGLNEMFDANKADLRGLNGIAHDLHFADMVQVNEFSLCAGAHETHTEVYPSVTEHLENQNQNQNQMRNFKFSDYLDESDYFPYSSLPLPLRPRQARLPNVPRLRFDRPFLYFVRHNPTGLILHMGRFNPRLAT